MISLSVPEPVYLVLVDPWQSRDPETERFVEIALASGGEYFTRSSFTLSVTERRRDGGWWLQFVPGRFIGFIP